jgi:hypothetical protein
MAEPRFIFYGELQGETDKCWFIFDGICTISMPKSQVRAMRKVRYDDWEFEVPEWIARQKGIIE